ncbi:HPr(Ser) kinase/phosphatase [Kyrpidia spormannii]|uniref:HPr kinase/phosphorylase n=2 Tax=Kyrpidia spormannii TaxID=2055160 RepID=A0ACA8Z6G2_9BACL|nr:HPr(Ser) kinase/phosphatase [Kyrpidia spormannii]CAB3389436.1 HPr kinase/phosphorylase [Kyrpidia spormannii]CAB3390156.1 HPr kinase/phosphorylase [Kyrpidia spormannii]
MSGLRVYEIMNHFHLELLAGAKGLQNPVVSTGINKPGLEFLGWFEYFDADKIQLLGKKETSFLSTMTGERRQKSIRALLQHRVPAVVFTEGIRTLQVFTEFCDQFHTPLLRTPEETTEFFLSLHTYLTEQLAPEIGVHGVLMELYGLGVLLRGVSGIGKSEVALSVIERGHRFVADDMVLLRRVGSRLIGSSDTINQDFLSLRGVGLLNIRKLYGIGSVRQVVEVNFEIELVPWDDHSDHDALGNREYTVSYLDVILPKIIIPIKPGRDIAEMVQVAARNHRLRATGYDAKEHLFRRLSVQTLFSADGFRGDIQTR